MCAVNALIINNVIFLKSSIKSNRYSIISEIYLCKKLTEILRSDFIYQNWYCSWQSKVGDKPVDAFPRPDIPFTISPDL